MKEGKEIGITGLSLEEYFLKMFKNGYLYGMGGFSFIPLYITNFYNALFIQEIVSFPFFIRKNTDIEYKSK